MSHNLLWLLLAAELVALFVVGPRLFRSARGGRRLVDVGEQSGQSARISVVIPARNESSRITGCLAPLRDAPGVHEVIVIDDQSSDDTAMIAESYGATVVHGAPLPDGWVGKIWALQQGITAASGEVIMTLDADARPHPSLPMSAADVLLNSGAALSTVSPRFRTGSAAGTWLHASMLTSLVYRHGAGSGRAGKDAVANGQCMVFRRDSALRGDWCANVSGEIIEDVALVRRLVHEGERVEMFDGSSLLTVHMFEGFRDTWRGWGRSLSLAGVDRPLRLWSDAFITLIAAVSPLWLLVTGAATPITVLLLLVRLGTLVGTARAYERRGLGYWLSPFADLLAWIVVVRGIVAPSREWRGRQY